MMIATLILAIFMFGVLGAMLWDMHHTNVRAHLETQRMLTDIARFLGTDRR